MTIHLKNAIWGAALCALIQSQVWASTGELYGYGSRASALANTMLGGISGGYGTFYNPAANSSFPGLNVSLGMSYAHPQFLDIQNVTVSNSAVSSDTADVIGNVDTSSYLDHLGQVLGVSFNLGEKMKNLTVGVTAFMPIERIAYLDTGEPFKPEYFSFRSRTQRPQIYGSVSLTPLKNFHVGTGLAFATNLSGSTTIFATGSANKVSYQRLATTIKPSVAPYFSIYTDPLPYQAGLTVRLPNEYNVSLDTQANANFLGGTASLPVNINSTSSVYYDPLEVDLAAAYQITPVTWVTAEVDWLHYKAFSSPTLTVTNHDSVATLNNSISNTPNMQNIIVPKVAFQHDFDTWILRGGYWYRPSPVKDNLGAGNLVDPAQHTVTAGVGFDLKKAKFTDKEIFLDLHGQYHYLVHQHVQKSDNNEANTSGQTKLGSPGYDIGGSVYGGGLSLTMNF